MNQQATIPSTTEPSVTLTSVPSSSADDSVRPQEPSPTGPQGAQSDPASHARCAHLFQSGRRCRRRLTDANSRFCPRHAKLPENLQPDDLTPELTDNPEDLDTFDGLHSFLEALLILLAQNRISTRRAAVLAYITSQLHRTLTAAHKENGEETPQIILDAPRPIRD